MKAHPESLWTRVFEDFREWIDSLIEIRIVTGFDEGGKIRTISTDPEAMGESVLSKLRGTVIIPGDQVITIRTPAGKIVVAPFAKETDEDIDYVSELGGDGSSMAAARADHNHTAPTGSVDGFRIGVSSSTTLRGHALGYGSEAADAATAYGRGAKALGFISLALGWSAKALQDRAVAMGYGAIADAPYSTALGANSSVTGDRSTVIGYAATETLNDRTKIKANDLVVERSFGSGSTKLHLQDPGGVYRSMYFDTDDRIKLGSHTMMAVEDPISMRYPVNRKVGATAAPLKSYPDDAAGGVAMPAGHQFHRFGGGFASAGANWWPAISETYGIGYVRQDLTVAI